MNATHWKWFGCWLLKNKIDKLHIPVPFLLQLSLRERENRRMEQLLSEMNWVQHDYTTWLIQLECCVYLSSCPNIWSIFFFKQTVKKRFNGNCIRFQLFVLLYTPVIQIFWNQNFSMCINFFSFSDDHFLIYFSWGFESILLCIKYGCTLMMFEYGKNKTQYKMYKEHEWWSYVQWKLLVFVWLMWKRGQRTDGKCLSTLWIESIHMGKHFSIFPFKSRGIVVIVNALLQVATMFWWHFKTIRTVTWNNIHNSQHNQIFSAKTVKTLLTIVQCSQNV